MSAARSSAIDAYKQTIAGAAAWSLQNPVAYQRLKLQARAEEVRTGKPVSPGWFMSRMRYLQRGRLTCSAADVDEARDLSLGMAAMMRGESLMASHGTGRVYR